MIDLKQTILQVMQEQNKHHAEKQTVQAEMSGLKKRSHALTVEINQINSDITRLKQNRKPKEGARDRSAITPIQQLEEKLIPLQAEQQEIVTAQKNIAESIKRLDAVITANQHKLINLREAVLKEQSTNILHAALKRTGLLKPIRELMELNKIQASFDGGETVLKHKLIEAFFCAIFLDGKHTLEDSLKAFNKLIGVETPTQETTH